MREIHPEQADWAGTLRTNLILVDIWDMLAQINANIVAIGSRRPAKKVKPYPTPWRKLPEEEQHFGKGALPPDELRKWFEEKRKNASSSISDLGSDSGLSRGATVIN